MDKYWIFDIERFLKDSKGWGRERLKLERELESLLDLKAMSQDTPVQTSNISDATGSTAVKRAEIMEEINKLDRKTHLLEVAYLELSKMEKDCIDTFFFSKGLLGARVDEFTFRWDCKRRYAYNTRRQALEKMREHIEKALR